MRKNIRINNIQDTIIWEQNKEREREIFIVMLLHLIGKIHNYLEKACFKKKLWLIKRKLVEDKLVHLIKVQDIITL